MHVSLRWLMVTAVCASWMGCTQAKQGEFAGVVQPEVLARSGLHYYAHFQVNLERGENVTRFYRLDENLYLMTNRHRVIACDARSLAAKWSYEFDSRDKPIFRPFHTDRIVLTDEPTPVTKMVENVLPTGKAFNAVMFNSYSRVIVLDRANGREVRRAELPFAASSGGIYDGGYFFACDAKGLMFAVSLAEEVASWTIPADNMVTSPLETFGRNVYVVSRSGDVHAARVGRTRQESWSTKVYGEVTHRIHVDERGCFIATNEGRLYALDATTGRPLWDPIFFRRPIQDAVQVGQSSLFQFVPGDGFHCLNLVSGQPRWKDPNGRMVLATMLGQVFLLDTDLTLHIKDEMQGRTESSIPMTGFDLFLANTTAPTIYAATRDGRLFSVRPAAAAPIKVEEVYPNAAKSLAPETQPSVTTKPAKSTTPKPPKATPKKPKAGEEGEAAPAADAGVETPKPKPKPKKTEPKADE